MTDIEQLERDLEYFTELLLENRNEEIENEVPAGMYCEIDVPVPTLERVMEAARAHMEAMKQEPAAYVSNSRIDLICAKQQHDGIGSVLWSENNDSGTRTPVYTAPPPAEQSVLKVPAFDEMYYRDALEQIITMNPHLKVEEI